MPTPQGINTVTLHGRFVEPDLFGTPLVGSVTFAPNVNMVTFPIQDTMMSGTETAVLDLNGEFTIDLPCTDTVGQNPDGWAYTVTEKLIGARSRTYPILLPFTMAVVELADITPTDATPGYLPVTGPQGPPGLVTSVNGISLPNIVLMASDVGAVDIAELGQPDGVATLGLDGKLASTQVPDLSSAYVTVARIGAANGVASLGADTKVPFAQLDLADATPAAITNSGGIGVGTQLAREDHSHAGVALTGVQTVAGAKTWSDAATFSAAITFSSTLTGSTAVGGQALGILRNTSGAATQPVLQLESDLPATLLTGKVPGDAQARFALRPSGQVEMGNGVAARDVSLYRSAAGILNSSGQLVSDAAAPSAIGHLTRKDYVDGQVLIVSNSVTALDGVVVKLTGNQSVAGEKTFTNQMFIADLLRSTRGAAGDSAWETRVTGDSAARHHTQSDGKVWWGPGNAVADTNLYRSAANMLKTDDSLTVTGSLFVSGIGQEVTAYKTADTARATATLTADPHLSFSLAANGVYQVSGVLFVITTDATNADLVLQWDIPAGASSEVVWFGQPTTASGGTGSIVTQTFETSTLTLGAITAARMGILVSGLISMGGSAGTYALTWARSGASGTVTLGVRSNLMLKRIA